MKTVDIGEDVAEGVIASKVIERGREIVIVIGGSRYSRGSDF